MANINDLAQFEESTMPIQRTFRKIFLQYLKKNANKPAVLLKLMQISKFFWIEEFPFLMVKELHFHYDRWSYLPLNEDKYEIYDREEVWVTGTIKIHNSKEGHVTEFLPNIAVLGLKELCLGHQNLTLKQLKFLTNGSIFLLCMDDTIVTDENGDIIPVEILLKLIPSVCEFYYYYNDKTALTVTIESTANLIKVLKNSKMKEFGLQEIPDTFDFKAFCKFLNVHGKNLGIKHCSLHFREDISFQFKEKLKIYNIQMIKETTDKYYPLWLSFPRQ